MTTPKIVATRTATFKVVAVFPPAAMSELDNGWGEVLYELLETRLVDRQHAGLLAGELLRAAVTHGFGASSISVAEMETIEVGGLLGEWPPVALESETVDELVAHVSVAVRIDHGDVIPVGVRIGVRDPAHGLDTWHEGEDLELVPRPFQGAVATAIQRDARRIWTEVEENRR